MALQPTNLSTVRAQAQPETTANTQTTTTTLPVFANNNETIAQLINLLQALIAQLTGGNDQNSTQSAPNPPIADGNLLPPNPPIADGNLLPPNPPIVQDGLPPEPPVVEPPVIQDGLPPEPPVVEPPIADGVRPEPPVIQDGLPPEPPVVEPPIADGVRPEPPVILDGLPPEPPVPVVEPPIADGVPPEPPVVEPPVIQDGLPPIADGWVLEPPIVQDGLPPEPPITTGNQDPHTVSYGKDTVTLSNQDNVVAFHFNELPALYEAFEQSDEFPQVQTRDLSTTPWGYSGSGSALNAFHNFLLNNYDTTA